MTTTTRESPTQSTKFTILDGITAALGGTVNKRAENDLGRYNPMAWQHITLPEGSVSLYYHEDRKGDYIHVSGDWPRDRALAVVTGRDAEYGTSNPSINVSATKGADVAARDIRRRFLPEFARLYAKAKAIIDERETYADTVAANYRVLAKACGGKADLSGGFNRNQWRVTGLPEGVEIKYVTAERVDLVLECTVEQAMTILRQRAGILAAMIGAGESLT